MTGYLERLCEIQQHDRSLSDVLTLRMPDSQAISEIRDQIYDAQLDLIRRAQDEGTLRGDLVPQDVILLLLATGGIISATAETRGLRWWWPGAGALRICPCWSVDGVEGSGAASGIGLKSEAAAFE